MVPTTTSMASLPATTVLRPVLLTEVSSRREDGQSNPMRGLLFGYSVEILE